MEAASNLEEQDSEYDEVYINTLEFESYAAAKVKTTHPRTIKAHHALEETMFINGKEASVLFDRRMIEANQISVGFFATHGPQYHHEKTNEDTYTKKRITIGKP